MAGKLNLNTDEIPPENSNRAPDFGEKSGMQPNQS